MSCVRVTAHVFFFQCLISKKLQCNVNNAKFVSLIGTSSVALFVLCSTFDFTAAMCSIPLMFGYSPLSINPVKFPLRQNLKGPFSSRHMPKKLAGDRGTKNSGSNAVSNPCDEVLLYCQGTLVLCQCACLRRSLKFF